MTTMEIRTSVLQDIAFLFDNDNAMTKLHTFVSSLKQEVLSDEKIKENSKIKKRIKYELREALDEVKGVREGHIQPKTMQDLYKELEGLE